MVLSGDTIKTAIAHSEAQRTVLLFDEKDGGAGCSLGGANELASKVLVKEVVKS